MTSASDRAVFCPCGPIPPDPHTMALIGPYVAWVAVAAFIVVAALTGWRFSAGRQRALTWSSVWLVCTAILASSAGLLLAVVVAVGVRWWSPMTWMTAGLIVGATAFAMGTLAAARRHRISQPLRIKLRAAVATGSRR